ncbi:MAG: alpha-ketoglutarate-dependent dioxygenase AlkB [Oscillatoriaceae cyanobacterium Prado104]|jgi:alkylated DNA repair dioxygenase AlkB|nr:alpha-ketoglutarate-dependent dioxygenase AlkB [Oscillatoriaceae cyanobacterium Prado104]
MSAIILSTIGQIIELANAEVIFYPRLFPQPESHQLFAELWERIEWKQEPIKIFGKSVLQPRLTAYYGTQAYTYSGVTMQPLPWNEPLLQIKQIIEPLVHTQFNGVLMNLYRNGQDYMGWHSDDENELVKGSTIASLSFGESRRFILRRRDNHQIKVELNLGDGDFLVMGGDTQKFWQHHVPKMAKSDRPRINLTFRVIEH